MSMRIGDVDVATQIIETEFRLAVLERVVDLLAHYVTVVGGPPVSSLDLQRIRKDVVEELQEKYPDSRIALKKLE